MTDTANPIPEWRVVGDWFDVCSCNVPCPCSFNEPPDDGKCDVVFAYKIRTGHYGDLSLAGLNVVVIGAFTGNLYEGDKIDLGALFDIRANEAQREALQLIFTGQVGGWQQQFIPAILGQFKGAEFAEIDIQIDDQLLNWSVKIPGVLEAESEPLSGPTADPNKRVQAINIPTSEVGPNCGPATLGKIISGAWNVFGFTQELPKGKNSKHIAFEWFGPDK